MAKKPSLIARANSRGVESLSPEVDDILAGKEPASSPSGLKGRIVPLDNGRLRIETFDPENEAIHSAEIDQPRSGSTDFVMVPNEKEDVGQVLDRYSNKGSLVPGSNARDVVSTSPGTGFTLGESGPTESPSRPSKPILSLASPEETADKFGQPKDAGEVLSNVLDYLKQNGMDGLAKGFLRVAVGATGAVGGGALGALVPTDTASDDFKGNADERRAQSDALMQQTDELLSSSKDNSPSDNDSSAFNIPPLSDSSASASNAPQSGSNGSTAQGSNSPATAPAQKSSASVRPSNAPTGRNASDGGNSRISDGRTFSDEEIHQWNLKHNPNYDPRLFDVASGSFNYNKGN